MSLPGAAAVPHVKRAEMRQRSPPNWDSSSAEKPASFSAGAGRRLLQPSIFACIRRSSSGSGAAPVGAQQDDFIRHFFRPARRREEKTVVRNALWPAPSSRRGEDERLLVIHLADPADELVFLNQPANGPAGGVSLMSGMGSFRLLLKMVLTRTRGFPTGSRVKAFFLVEFSCEDFLVVPLNNFCGKNSSA